MSRSTIVRCACAEKQWMGDPLEDITDQPGCGDPSPDPIPNMTTEFIMSEERPAPDTIMIKSEGEDTGGKNE